MYIYREVYVLENPSYAIIYELTINYVMREFQHMFILNNISGLKKNMATWTR